ncbi:MAG: DNA polymerase III subunit alpha [Candidatus Terrybacteria bacterium RIFCSPHIGHO2_01_FULL_48_17]|uniref:DNA polymerase III subunit alpha n=1 Tax=Candidatus Terrybacteria bacterium RIFCSPHIGHO2_01_FULL_48_17 TaxID=1802362 RepID=A0A1G2PH37_9BACT|nr:MAG: DNA polymerase III subunit alpha [Candidatus Terrybacteria bacterium RIFCSPHIGHO2_01_FULL_48_17]OHA53121.1 MAG: DNA polymerase III subunit alpha [Candidatus Terrybacteria bacterium RIFCSPLOWO2_01_FULL_48_14]
MASRFVHLHVHSHYSFLDGLAKIDQLVARAKELGMDALAITDHGGLWGAVEFYKKAKAQGIKPIIGAELYVATRSRFDRDPQLDTRRFHLTVLAKNNIGYQNLVKLVTKSQLEGFYFKPRVDKELLRTYHEGLIALSGCLGGEIPRAIESGNMKHANNLLTEYLDIFGRDNFFLELGAHNNIPQQKKLNTKLIELGKQYNVPLVATNDIHYVSADDKDAHEVLLSVQTASRFDDESRLSLKTDDFSLKSAEQMDASFPNMPEVLKESAKIAEQCNVTLPIGAIQLPMFPVPEGYTPDSYLKKLCDEGLTKRYDANYPPQALERLSYELSVIEKTGFASYFLIVQDFVSWAKGQGIVVGPGRGSAAGSFVAYVLGITNIDPLRYELLFERFLNPARVSMPDIDLDFADWRRDEVIQYLRQKYGDEHVAQIGTFGTMAARAVVRDAGRSLGFPYSFCDRVAKLIPFGMTLEQALKASQELSQAYENEADVARLVDSGRKLEGVARHISTHACGVVISKEPLTKLVPLQHPSQSEEHVISQYEMHSIEDLGLLKIDLLGLRNLSIIEETIGRIKNTYREEVDIERLPLDDAKTFELLRTADTTGVFQLEGGGMRRYLKELVPTELEDIIAMISLYRPGPMEFIPSFIKRKHGKEKVEYLDHALESILKKTHGIAVYQEQLMEIARQLAGFSLAEADMLRKAVGKKIKSLLNEQHEKLVAGMMRNKITKNTAEKIWEWIIPFARYGFNRSHGACYAMIAYQTAWLKAHYPYEFMASLLNREYGMGTDRVAVLIQEARAHEIKILPPDVNASREGFTVVYKETKNPGAIRFGLTAIKNLGHNVVTKIITERDTNGAYTSLENFIKRIAGPEFTKKALESLTYAGALDQFAERKAILESTDQILSFGKESHRNAQSGQGSLFDETSTGATLRLKETKPASKQERLRWEKDHLGLWVSEHPLRSYERLLATITKPIEIMRDAATGRQLRIGGVITKIKKILTKKGEPMLFVNVEDMSGTTEVVVFPRVLENYPTAFKENAIVLLDGTVSERNGEMGFICERAEEIVEKAEEIVRRV